MRKSSELKRSREISNITLFPDTSLERMRRKKERPLPYLSDFVIDKMPIALANGTFAKVFQKFEQRHLKNPQKLIRECNQISSAEKMQVARLDLLLLEAALRHVGYESKVYNYMLTQIHLVSQGVGILTYEDIVLNNPEDDIRTFTHGKVGRQEADFYIGHKIIEEKLNDIILLLSDVSNGLQAREFNQVLQKVLDIYEDVIALTKIISMKMDKKSFELFRGYLGSKLDSNGNTMLKGPSGAFSARVPILDFLVRGELSEEHKQYVSQNFDYFPVQTTVLLSATLLRKAKPLRQIAIDLHANVQLVVELEKKIKTFRGAHLAGVRHQIPEVFSGAQAGTGGEGDVSGFLKRRINE